MLAHVRFPASQDDLLAALVRQRAPSRLLQHVACLSREDVFGNVEDVLRACCEQRPGSRVRTMNSSGREGGRR